MWFIWIIIVLLSLAITSVTTLPLVFVAILCLFVLTKKLSVILLAVFLGLILDIFSLNVFGKTSLFFVVFLFLVGLYDRKFEIQTLPFVIISSFLGSTIYLLMFGSYYILWQALVSSLIAVLIFKFL